MVEKAELNDAAGTLSTLATKADLAELRGELLVKLEAMRADFRTGEEALRADFRTGQEALRADLIKWMAGMLITILLSFVGMFVGLTRTLTLAATVPQATTAKALEPTSRSALPQAQPGDLSK